MTPRFRCFPFSTIRRQLLHTLIIQLLVVAIVARPAEALIILHNELTAIKLMTTSGVDPSEQRLATMLTGNSGVTTGRTAWNAPSFVPLAATRTLQAAGPTPSGAKPAYPPNHILDSAYQPIGTPPVNHDFETPGFDVGTLPTNYDFSSASYPSSGQPANADFSTGNFNGWTPGCGCARLADQRQHVYC